MPFKTRFLFASLLILLTVLLGIWLTPFAVSNGVRFWLWRKARQEGLVVKFDKIDAPFLRPVVISGLRVTSTRENAFSIDLTATEASVDLNLKRILLHARGRTVHNLSIGQLHGELSRKNPSGRALSQRAWTTLHNLLPENVSVGSSNLRFEDGPTVILLRSAILSASETEAGRFSADEIMIASPWFRQTFSRLRGATSWQGNRLTLAGLSLTRGLDLQSVTADLSRVSKQRVGLEFDVDAFGGKIRASISHQWRPQHSTWKMAGSATDISLAQTSEAIGFTDRVGGLLHACNFTFRGNPDDPTHATASLWTELTGLTWRNRTAEAIMLGAALYNRQIELQQLYIKQRANQLTLSGEASFPSNSSDWLSPDFRGDISASISNLGDFAGLFGADPGDFAGTIAIDGAMNARDRKIGGHLILEGASLTLFTTAIDTLNAKLNLKATELEIEQLDLQRKNDSLSAQGKIDMSHSHDYSGTINVVINDLSPYLSTLGTGIIRTKPVSANAQITINSGVWDGSCSITIADSKPISLNAQFPLRIGGSWNTFLDSPVVVKVDFPAVFLPNAQQYFDLEIFRDGTLSGSMSTNGTLQQPKVDLEVQLMNGRLENGSFALTELSGRARIERGRGVIDFLHASTKDADLSFSGDIDIQDLANATITLTSTLPVFDLTPRQIDCVGRIAFSPIGIALAPVINEMEFRGGLLRSGWTMTLQPPGRDRTIDPINITTRTIPLCLGAASGNNTLILGASSRPQPSLPRPRRRGKAR